MSENQFPTKGQIEQRTDQIIEGIGYPYLPALAGIAFRRLTLAEKGEASRAYSRHLMDEINSGDRISERLVPDYLRIMCAKVDIDVDELMAQEEALQRRIFDEAPADLRDTGRRLTEEEIVALPAEEQQAYIDRLKEKRRQIEAFIDSLFTPEEKAIRGRAKRVELLESDLKAQTAEHHARVRRRMVEILHGARRLVEGAPPERWPAYFESLEEIYDLEDTDPDTWLAIGNKWREFKAGKWPGFTQRSSSTPTHGV